MREIGKKTKEMVLVYINIRMVIYMRAIGKTMKKKEMEFIIFKMVIFMKDNST